MGKTRRGNHARLRRRCGKGAPLDQSSLPLYAIRDRSVLPGGRRALRSGFHSRGHAEAYSIVMGTYGRGGAKPGGREVFKSKYFRFSGSEAAGRPLNSSLSLLLFVLVYTKSGKLEDLS